MAVYKCFPFLVDLFLFCISIVSVVIQNKGKEKRHVMRRVMDLISMKRWFCVTKARVRMCQSRDFEIF